jgi:hypothetical protein
MSQSTGSVPSGDDADLATSVPADRPDQNSDVPSGGDGVGIGADSEPDTFEPEEPEVP